MIKTSLLTNLSTSATQVAIQYDEVDGGGGKLVKNLSKRSEKSAKAFDLEESNCLTSDTRLAFTKMGSSHTYNRKLLTIVETFKNWKPCQLQTQSSCLH